MRDADGTIERLLAGMRDAEPPAGIERRILEALDGMEAHKAVAPASLWRWPLGLAVALLLASAVTWMISVHQHRHAPVMTSADVRQEAKPRLIAQKAPSIPRRIKSRAPMRSPQDGESQTASFPAPPLPLTEQEKLLLRLAHRGDRDNMAVLNPDVRAAQTAKATEQFQQFFAINATEMRSQSE
jgi:hypothetical protein